MCRDDAFLFSKRSYKYCLFNDRVSDYRIDCAWLTQSQKQSAIKITMRQIVFRYSQAHAWALKEKARINFEKSKSFRLFRLGKRPGLLDEEYIKSSRSFGLGFIDITS